MAKTKNYIIQNTGCAGSDKFRAAYHRKMGAPTRKQRSDAGKKRK
jgi:hypothetical protein